MELIELYLFKYIIYIPIARIKKNKELNYKILIKDFQFLYQFIGRYLLNFLKSLPLSVR